MSETGTNNLYLRGPHFIALGPEHAATLARDGWTISRIRKEAYYRSRINFSRVSAGNRKYFEARGAEPVEDYYYLGAAPNQIHILVAGGPGKHSSWIPSFGATGACSQLLP